MLFNKFYLNFFHSGIKIFTYQKPKTTVIWQTNLLSEILNNLYNFISDLYYSHYTKNA